MAPLWTSFHLGDQGRHGTSSVYENWKNAFSKIPCIQAPTKIQGIVKYHHKSLKHIELPKGRNRLVLIVKQLFNFKVLKYRQYAIDFSQRRKRKTIESKRQLPNVPKEMFKKRKSSKGPGFYQRS